MPNFSSIGQEMAEILRIQRTCGWWVVGGGGGGGGGVLSDYFVSTQLQLWLFYCLGCGCC